MPPRSKQWKSSISDWVASSVRPLLLAGQLPPMETAALGALCDLLAMG